MSIPFLITGLPRSRTAWLSVFFNCVHEGMNGHPTVRSMLDSLEGGGNSDSSLCLFADQVLEEVARSECRLVVIHRSEAEVRASLRQVWGNRMGLTADEIIDKMLSGYETLRDSPLAYHVNFNDLSDLETMQSLWQFLYLSESFPMERNYRLQAMKITQIFDLAEARLIAV